VSVSNKTKEISFVYRSGQVSDVISSATILEPSMTGGKISLPNPCPDESEIEENGINKANGTKYKNF
jgi:hypothetical protein